MIPYREFLAMKGHSGGEHGFEPLWIPDQAFPFQRDLITWALRKGRGALFEDCGLGKTLQFLTWAENVARKTGKRVLIATPLAVAHQTVAEGKKFGIEVERAPGKGRIVVTNYERLHHLDPGDFVGMVCDESSAIKNFEGERVKVVTEFMRRMPYRLMATATPSPNDFIELLTSSEALGEMGRMDGLSAFFPQRRKLEPPDMVGREVAIEAPRARGLLAMGL